jgi:prepilin peptidase CpaA
VTLSLVATLLLLLYCALLVAGAVQDVISLRISNLICVAVLAVAAAALVVDPGPGWWEHPLSFAIMLGLGIALFALGWFGGGDAKLMAAAAMAFDLGGLVRFVLGVLILGGLVAILSLVFGRLFRRNRGLLKERRSIPYGVAIAAGALVSVWLFPHFTVFGAGEAANFFQASDWWNRQGSR